MLSLTINDEVCQLLPQRALFRPKNKSLYVADTHWGKDETFRAHHIPLPEGGLNENLSRLSSALNITSAERLVILGDLVHSSHSLTSSVVKDIATWRKTYANLEVQLIEGNHDRGVGALPSEWRVKTYSSNFDDEGIFLSHKPLLDVNYFSFCGHLHPTWTIRGQGKQQVNLPCFLQTNMSLIFPAFSLFSGSNAYQIHDIQHVYAITETQVLKIK